MSSEITSHREVGSPLFRTRARFIILAVISVATLINYLDRTVLGIAAPYLSKDLALSPAMMGLVFSAFSWTYAAAQIPGGIFLDRFGTKLTYYLSLTFWSVFTLLQAFSTGIYTLLFYRFGLGVSEAPCFPTNGRIVGNWFPQHERARATSIYTVGEYLGLAAFGPALFWVTAAYGWKAMFIIVGVVGVVFGFVWWGLYRDPQDSKMVNQAELDYIAAGGGLTPKGTETLPFTWENCKKLLQFRQIWGAGLGQFAGNTTLVFFLTWFPTYLATARHMGWVKVGFFAVLPFLAAAIGILIGGWASDQILKKTGSANLARKGPIIFGLLLASAIVTANFVDSDYAVIAILSMAFFGQGMVGLGWTLISDIITPIVIGFIIGATGSFVWALAFVGAVALFGVFSYVVILGDVKPLVLE
jgi:ACS family D-galactonate transporter-like MFS transporter